MIPARRARRTAFAVCTVFACGQLFAGSGSAQGASRSRTLVIGVLSYETGEATAADSLSRNAERGLWMGIDEGAETARLFGRDVKESRLVVKRGDDAAKAARILARTADISALVVTNPELLPAAESVAHNGFAVIVMQTLPAPAFDCSKFVFAVYPPATALESVRPEPNAAGRSVTSRRAAVELWNAKLQRFGALELNDRFRARWKTGMTSEAWAAWVAVKILSEAALRKQSVEPFALLAYITKSEFDGHKGWPLTFRAADHLLRQPFYIVSEPRTASFVELPAGGRSDTESAASVLDRILPTLSNPKCADR